MNFSRLLAAHRRRPRRLGGSAAARAKAPRPKRPSPCSDDMKRADSQLFASFDAGRVTQAVFTSMVGLGD